MKLNVVSSLAGKLDDVIEEFLNSYERDENRSQSSFYDVGLALIFLLFSCYFHGNRLICLYINYDSLNLNPM